MKEVDVVIDLADRDVVLGRLIAGELEVEFATNVRWEGRTLELVAIHLYGAGANSMGIRTLRKAVQALMLLLDVDQVIVEGALRTTGAATGPAGSGPRLPRRLIFNREVR